MTQLLQYLLAGGGVILGVLVAWGIQSRRYAKTVEKAKTADVATASLDDERKRREASEVAVAEQLKFEWAEAKKEAANVTDEDAALALALRARARLRGKRP